MRTFNTSMLSANEAVEIVTVGPDQATELLKLNAGNRRENQSRTLIYRRAMEQDLWALSPDAIVVEKGMLRNGQHRLRAVIASGRTLPFMLAVNCGVPFDVIDNGKNRTAGDILGLALGESAPFPGALGTVVKLVLRRDGVASRFLVDNRRIENFAAQNPELVKLVAMVESDRRAPTCDMPAGVGHALAAVRYVTGTVYGIAPNTDLADFSDALLMGWSQDPDDPVSVLRRQIIKNLSGATRSRYGAPDFVTLISRALLAQLAGQPGPKNYRADREIEWRELFSEERTVMDQLAEQEIQQARS